MKRHGIFPRALTALFAALMTMVLLVGCGQEAKQAEAQNPHLLNAYKVYTDVPCILYALTLGAYHISVSHVYAILCADITGIVSIPIFIYFILRKKVRW